MTKNEATKIRSAFCNGYEYPFGNGLHENCDMKEVERHALILEDAINKQVPKPPIDGHDLLANVITCCPNCKQPIVNVWNKSDYKPKYCHFCGQALAWEG